ncbi:MAG TPA: mechanosensitive ion channel family protein, partial [Planctomycetota bacterium]|nr:mechanosensitive ion channel family protein [Planctomycetota bacterium]
MSPFTHVQLLLQGSASDERSSPKEAPPDLWSALTHPEAWVQRAIDFLPDVARALIVLGVFWGLYVMVRFALQNVLARSRMDPALTRLLLFSFLRWAMLFVAIVMAAGQLGFNVTAALAGLGVAGIAVGLAAQDTIANVIAGITIFLDRPFKVGDWVTSGDTTGLVAEIRVRSTRIRTRNNTFMVVPNRLIVDSVIVNHSLYGDVRVDIPIGIAYKENIPEARRVILAAVEGSDLILEGRSDVVLESLG